MDALFFMAAPVAACLILVSMHAYLGLHILARGVIFVDLALAQIAAFGAALAVMAGHNLHSPVALAVSLGAAFLGAVLFAATRSRRVDLPQEAIIGIVYVVAAAASILVLDRSPHGTEHLKTVLVGQILWVSWRSVAVAAVVYVGVGVLHWLFREPFLRLSGMGSSAQRSGLTGQPSPRLWDFFFYATFGLVITVSVPMAGVLLVFSFLIVPAVCAALFSGQLRRQLWIAWGIGLVASVIGCGLSFGLDTPTGATIVCTFGVLLGAVGLWRAVTGGGAS